MGGGVLPFGVDSLLEGNTPEKYGLRVLGQHVVTFLHELLNCKHWEPGPTLKARWTCGKM